MRLILPQNARYAQPLSQTAKIVHHRLFVYFVAQGIQYQNHLNASTALYKFQTVLLVQTQQFA